MRTHPISTRTTLILTAIVLLAPLVSSLIICIPEKTRAVAADHATALLERASPT